MFCVSAVACLGARNEQLSHRLRAFFASPSSLAMQRAEAVLLLPLPLRKKRSILQEAVAHSVTLVVFVVAKSERKKGNLARANLLRGGGGAAARDCKKNNKFSKWKKPSRKRTGRINSSKKRLFAK